MTDLQGIARPHRPTRRVQETLLQDSDAHAPLQRQTDPYVVQSPTRTVGVGQERGENSGRATTVRITIPPAAYFSRTTRTRQRRGRWRARSIKRMRRMRIDSVSSTRSGRRARVESPSNSPRRGCANSSPWTRAASTAASVPPAFVPLDWTSTITRLRSTGRHRVAVLHDVQHLARRSHDRRVSPGVPQHRRLPGHRRREHRVHPVRVGCRKEVLFVSTWCKFFYYSVIARTNMVGSSSSHGRSTT